MQAPPPITEAIDRLEAMFLEVPGTVTLIACAEPEILATRASGDDVAPGMTANEAFALWDSQGLG
jgi:hypothetical protein